MELALAPTPLDHFPLNLMVGLQMKELAPGHSRKVLLGLGMGTTGPRSLVAKAWKEMGKYISYCISTTELHMLQVLHICMCMYIFHHCMVPCGSQFTGMVIVVTEVNIIFCHSQTICGPKGNSFRVLAYTSLKRESPEDMKPLFWSKIKSKFKLIRFKKTKKVCFLQSQRNTRWQYVAASLDESFLEMLRVWPGTYQESLPLYTAPWSSPVQDEGCGCEVINQSFS